MLSLIRLLTQSKWVWYLVAGIAIIGFYASLQIKIHGLELDNANLVSDLTQTEANLTTARQNNQTLNHAISEANDTLIRLRDYVSKLETDLKELNEKQQQTVKKYNTLSDELDRLKNENADIEAYLNQRVPDDIIERLCVDGYCDTRTRNGSGKGTRYFHTTNAIIKHPGCTAVTKDEEHTIDYRRYPSMGITDQCNIGQINQSDDNVKEAVGVV